MNLLMRAVRGVVRTLNGWMHEVTETRFLPLGGPLGGAKGGPMAGSSMAGSVVDEPASGWGRLEDRGRLEGSTLPDRAADDLAAERGERLPD